MNYVGPRLKAVLFILGDLVMLAVAVVAIVYSFETVLVSLEFGSVTHGLRISQAWFLSAVPLGFTLMVVRLLQSLCRDLRDLRDGHAVYEGATLFE